MTTHEELEQIPGVGKAIAEDLRQLGITSVRQLQGKDPERLYRKLCRFKAAPVDRCMLYVFRCAVYCASTRDPDPELLKWWNWKDRAHGEKILKQTKRATGSLGNAMKSQIQTVVIGSLLLALSSGCQIVNTGTETRMDEQMLKVSFENAQAEALFAKIIYGTDRETHVKGRVGTPSVSLYARTETVAFNAHCNDHIRAMDKNSDLVISQREAEIYYQYLSEQGQITNRK